MTGHENSWYFERDAHALAVGKIVLAWNEFHEMLGEIFANLLGATHWEQGLVTWHALESDRAQRKMLRAMAQKQLKPKSKALEEIKWLLNQTDSLISKQRNIGVHAPIVVVGDRDGTTQLLPMAFLGNRHARQLLGKDILLEYAHYEAQLQKMLTFALIINNNVSPIRGGSAAWPPRPTLSIRPLP
jgi:hypothetical protein